MGDETLLERILNGDEEPKDLPLALLQSITNDFSDDRKIGQGGFGAVYKGELQNGIIVAVKRIEVNQITIDDVSFRREFNLMNMDHRNVVRFLGFCSNTHHIQIKEAGEINLVNVRERLLCFEYIRNGSLDKHITDELRGLEWEPRYAIISGICKGLFYLHEEKKIVHMDLKPPNILLDDHMVPKITDFGLSRSNEMSHTTGQRFRTPGYVAPEYEKDGKTSFKCDMYSLGVIITELVTGRKSVPHKNNVLRRWRHRWNKPPTLLQYRQVTRCIEISVRCRQQESGHRPSILEIVNILGESESMDGHTGQESAYLDDDMLRIEPLELKLNEEMSWSVKLTNKTKASFAFNIERPSQQYTIWPDKGIVTPGCNEYLVQITLQPQQRAPQVTQNADKIIFQSTKVPEGLRDEDITENIFHEEAGKVVDEVDLMIVYEPTKPKENCKSREDTNMPAEEVPEAKRRKIVESAFGKGKLGSSEKAEAASMETETETLKGNLLRVKQRITDGERNGLIPTEEAEDWVQRAEQAISEEADNRESFDQRCRIFECSLNCRGNYKTSKKAADKVDAVRKYISSTPLPDNITRTPPPPPVVDLSTHSVQFPPSRERILKNALMCIKEDVAVGVIGIWGQDGDEKTHLLKKINDSFLGECPFDFVIFVTASSELSVQAQIISRLRTDTVPDVATQATRISELLKKKSFLLLVDDLRVQLDLQAVGIPHPLGDVKAVQRKVVVTSISQSICHLMDVERYIQVPDLEEHETRQLFAEEYGQQDPYSDPGIGALAEQLVRELKGLPSDLIRYGKVMQGIRDVRRWEDAIDAVRKANLQRDDPLNLAEKIVRNLENATKDLDAKGNDVRREIVDVERQQRTPTNEMNRWLQKVDNIIRDVQVISHDCRQLKKDVTMLASEKLREVQECLRSCPSTIAVESMPPPVQEMPGPSMSVEDPNLKMALQYIKDDPRVGMIGIWGPRGVGKTHLLTKINNSFLEYCPFDIVILIKASSECTVQKVQAQIINRFSINQNVNVTAQIYELLKKLSFLVLVDDLCEKLDLSAVGIPHPLGVVDQKKRKVLIISRSQSICDLMGVDKYIEVLGLEEDEAHQLFEQSFGEENLYTDPHVGVLAKDLVRELMGRPSELIHFGKMMRRSRNARQWEDVIDAVKRSNLRKDNPLCMAERIVGSLEDSTKDLIAKKNDVCQKIKNAEREGKKSTNEVDRWLEKVAKIIDVVHVISVDCKLKKDVTMEASEKLREVQECLSICLSTVAIESMPPPVQEMPGPSMLAENRNLQDALQYIKDDPKVGMIGIWGPGGVGKTHLLNNINNSFGDGMTFDFVIFVTASRGCSVEKVQSQIIERLRLQSTGCKRLTIHEYMKTKSFLVLLDDLWDEINLEDVGIPYPLGNVNKLDRKVVLTTRLRKVCGQMKVKKELKVAYLQEHEAWQLFKENIGAETLSSPHIEALARELMKELKGLPLALITIGKAMYRKDEYQWETAIQYMKQSCCAVDKDPIELGMETNVFRQLKFSYDNLRNKTLRDCFLTCALWPEDENISKVDLAQCWMGLGLVNEHDIESSVRKSYSLIADLTAACLLEGCEYVDIPSYYRNSHGFVKVHDVIRDMALWISRDCGENNDKWIVAAPGGRDEKVIILSNKAECISLMSNRVPIRFNLDPIKLRILCLQNNELDESIIVEAIKNCSSLTYLDLSENNLKRIPEELCSLVKLEYLDLSENQFVGETEVPHSFGKLINLKFLYLKSGSGYVRIPVGVMCSLKALQVIDLRCDITEFLSSLPEWIFRELGTLPQLKALGSLVQGSAQFKSLLGEAANLPVRYLTLWDVGEFIGILATDFAQRTLYELHIIDDNTQQITVSYDTQQPNNHFGALNYLRLSFMTSLREIKWMGATPAFIFPRLTCLVLFRCERLSHLSWVMYLPRLERLHIAGCGGMVQAFMRCHGDKLCNGQDKTKTFPCLKIIWLNANRSLKTIGDNGMEFPSLERLVIYDCPKLKRLPFQLDSLPLKLKELRFDSAYCWERLECEEGVKSFLQPALKFGT